MNKKLLVFVVGAMCLGAFLFGVAASTMLSAQNESTVTAPAFIPPTFSFLNDLKIGDNSQDVRQLQIFLNSDANTRISDSGVGSKGQESTYFGQLTRNALMRFQLRNGLNATGFVGPATRAKLNQLILTRSVASASVGSAITNSLSTSTPTSSTSLFSGPLPLQEERLPRLYTVRPQQIRKGDTFTLVGAGFQTENTLRIGSFVFNRVVPQDGNNISFKIPATSGITNGTYIVSVENSKGNSRVVGQDISITITDSPQTASVISSVVPSTVSLDGIVTVNGSGFTSSGNDIVSRFGKLENVSSNGTQITFKPRSLMESDFIRKAVGTTIKLDFYVFNNNGVSNVKGSVMVKL